jgi:hypothetical protein
LQFWTIPAVFELRLAGAGDDGIYRKPEQSSLGSSASSNLVWFSERYEGEAENMLPLHPDDFAKTGMDGVDEIDKANKLMRGFDQDAELGAKSHHRRPFRVCN